MIKYNAIKTTVSKDLAWLRLKRLTMWSASKDVTYCWWKCKIVRVLWKTAWQAHPDIYTREMKACIYQKKTYIGMLFHNNPNMVTTEMSTNRWMDEQTVALHTMESHSAIKRNKLSDTQRHEWTSETWWAKEDRHKRLMG